MQGDPAFGRLRTCSDGFAGAGGQRHPSRPREICIVTRPICMTATLREKSLDVGHGTSHWGVRCDDSKRIAELQLVAVALEQTSTVSRRLPLTRLAQRDTLHACPHPECSRAVPALLWACSEHWQALPAPIRQGIWSATRDSGPGSPQLQAAEERAFAFWGAIERELRALAAGEHPAAGTPAEPPRTTA
jgi:hypothetical protein